MCWGKIQSNLKYTCVIYKLFNIASRNLYETFEMTFMYLFYTHVHKLKDKGSHKS